MKKALLSCTCLIFATPVNAWSLSDILGTSYDKKFLSACEHVLKQRLKSPSSYQRLSDPIITKEKSTFEDKLGWTNPDKKRADTATLTADPEKLERHKQQETIFGLGEHTLIRAYLEYEASNSYGALIRGYAECTHSDISPDKFTDLDKMSVMIDGYTHVDWLLSAPN